MAYQHTTNHITRAIRRRANEIMASGLDPLDLIIAADELDRLNRASPDSEDTLASFKSFITEAFNTQQTATGNILMAIQKEVQDLLDAVNTQSAANAAAVAEITALEGHSADVEAKLAALQAQATSGPAIGPDDLAAIVAATKTVSDSVASLKAAMPLPVAAPVVDAAAAAAAADPAAPAA